jgi:predicted ATPase/class 3 adenylate cyclase/DNA-binding CsgD family transcriptional regulator
MISPEQAVSDFAQFRSRRTDPKPPPRPAALPTGTVTFLLTDIEGSTRAWEAHGPDMAQAVARHYEILDAVVTAHNGVRPVEQGEGDSVVAVFERASDAVASALDAQRSLHQEPWPNSTPVAVRMAVHSGEAQLRDERYYTGPTIIRCARLRALGHGGQVLISNTTADLMADGLPTGTTLLPLGMHRLRDLRQPERVFQLCSPDLPSHFPPLQSLDAVANNLPAQITSFIGREENLAELTTLLGEHRLLTLVGAGGCGKTRLAVQLAAETSQEYPDGVNWVELASVTDPAQVPQAVTTALGLLEWRSLEPLARITTYFAERKALILFDNCEHVLGAVAALADGMLRACPRLSVLATSREPLSISGEVSWRVPTLTLPAIGPTPLDGLLASEAGRLFIDRAGDARPTFRVDADIAPTIAAICARLDGIPLAIELAAARIRTLSPERILEGLSERFRLLTGGSRTALPRQQTLQASVEWSHDPLSVAERTLFRRLAAFSGGFTLDAAEDVTAADPLEEWEVLSLLSDLVEKSLVVFDGRRYHLLQTIHDFARTRLVEAGEAEQIRQRHAAWCIAEAERAAVQLELAPEPAVLEALEADHDNFRAALAWLVERADGPSALRLVNALRYFWDLRGHYTEGIRWHRQALDLNPEPTPLRAIGLTGLAFTRGYGMQVSDGYGMVEAEQAVALGEHLGEPALALRPSLLPAILGGFGGDPAVLTRLDELAAAARDVDDTWSEYSALMWRAFHTVVHANRPDVASPSLSRLRTLAEYHASRYWQAWCDGCWGIAALRQGRLTEARRLLTPAVAEGGEVGNLLLQLYTAGFLWEVTLAEGDLDEAAAMLRRNISLQDRAGTLCREEWLDIALAQTLMAGGDLVAARREVERSAAGIRQGGVPFLMINLGVISGLIALYDDQLEAAAEALAEAEGIAAQLGSPWFSMTVHHATGLLARAERNLTRAEDEHHQALAICVEYEFRGAAADPLEALASLAVAAGSYAEAARLAGAADTLRQDTTHCRWPIDEPTYRDDLQSTRNQLGADSFGQAWSDGAALTLDAAAAYASRARGERKRPTVGWAALTPTELEVVALAAAGLTNAAIGARLFISPATAKTHLEHIYAKVGLPNRAALAAEAALRGIGRPDTNR